MRTMGETIKSLRNEHHLSQEQFAKIFKVAPSAVGMWENDKRSPNEETKEAIADYFNVDMNYLYGKTPIRNSYRDTILYEKSDIDYIRIPLYPPLCCGNGGFVEDDIIEYVPVPSKSMSPINKYFCQIADGESMKDAGINNGDLLVFEATSKINVGVIGCFCVDDNIAMCKKYKEQSGIIMLQPMNSECEPILVDPLNESFKCLGILRKVIKDFHWEE